MTLDEFKEYISKEQKFNCKNWKFSIECDIGNKKKLKNNNKTLQELGICQDSRIIADSDKKYYHESYSTGY